MSATHMDVHDLERRLRDACAELERRLRAGDSYRAEDCLAQHPELAADGDAALELIYFEYVLREDLGQAPVAADWYRRFPAHERALAKILQIHHGTAQPSPSASALATLLPRQTVQHHRPPPKGRVNKYRLLEELGRGSMGVVYKAREPALDRSVALKMILAGPHAGPDQLLRVHREARAVARLQHPNIVQIYEIGEDDGQPFLSMEFVNGPGLDRLLAHWHDQGSLGMTPHDAARLVASLAGAVHYAHQQGVVHRDLKPANILLHIPEHGLPIASNAPRGAPVTSAALQAAVPKIADFGLAKFLDGSADATQTGHVLGTPSFMAPEQAAGRTEAIGPAVDIYALGVMLYELLTGRVPFQAPTVQETLELVRTAEPAPPRQLQPNLPRDLQTICLKCLAKEPASRYANALALAEDLRRFLAGEPIQARPATRTERTLKWVKRRPIVAGLFAALVLTVGSGTTGIIWQWGRAEHNAAQAHRNAQKIQRERDKAIEERARAEHHLHSARASIDELAKLGKQLCLQPQTNNTGKKLIEKVLTFYQELLKDENTDPAIRLATAQVCGDVAAMRHTLGQMDEAVQDFRQESNLLRDLIKEYPDKTIYRLRLSVSLRNRANVLRDMGKPPAARDAYRESATLAEQVLATGPNNPHYQTTLANTLLNMATVLLLKEHEPEVEALYRRAVDLIKAALKTSPRNTGFQRELALALEGQGMLYWQQGKPAQAEQAVRAGVEIRERLHNGGQLDRWTERYLGRAYGGLALIVGGRGRSREAEQLYERAIDILGKLVKDFPDGMPQRTDLVRVRMAQANLYAKLGNYPRAAAHFRQAVHLDPNSGPANNNLAWFLATCPDHTLRDPPEAVWLAKQAIAAERGTGDNWNTLGAAQFRAGDYQAAIATLTKSMPLRSGGDSYDWYFLAMAHCKLGDRAEARRWLDKAMQWHQINDRHNAELHRFRAEARALLQNAGDRPTKLDKPNE